MSLGLGIGIGVPFAGGVSQDYPYSLSANGLLWLRADDAPNPVSSWVDRYGNFTLSQGTGTRQPAKTTATFGSKTQAVVAFDGAVTTGDVLVSTGTMGANLDAYTLIGVYKRTIDKSFNGILGVDATPANHAGDGSLESYLSMIFAVVHNRSPGPTDSTIQTFAALGITDTGNYYAITVAWRVGFLPDYYVNGTKIVTGGALGSWNQIATSGKSITIGLGYDSATGYFGGEIAELIWLDAYKTEAELTGAHAYVRGRYPLW